MQDCALEGVANIALYTPYVHATKADIAKDAGALNVPIADTWSCYKGGDIQCGKCGTCVERIEALYLAGVEDPSEYEDPDYWQDAIQHNAVPAKAGISSHQSTDSRLRGRNS